MQSASFAPIVLFLGGSQFTWRKRTFLSNKERFRLAENLRSTRYLPSVFSQVHAARKTNFTTVRARTSRMLPNDRKDQLIPLCTREFSRHFFALFVYVEPFPNLLLFSICFQNFLFSLSRK